MFSLSESGICLSLQHVKILVGWAWGVDAGVNMGMVIGDGSGG